MEYIKDIFQEIKNRFSNPLFFAFICSWLVINWRITIALLWFNPSQIKMYGYASVFNLIEANSTTKNSLLYPFLCAISYTICIPIIKNLIKAFNSWATKWGENWNLKVLDGAKISLSKYMALRSEYFSRSKVLADAFENEAMYIENNKLLTDQLDINHKRIEELVVELSNSKKRLEGNQDLSVLNGRWELSELKEDAMYMMGSIKIQNGNWFTISDDGKEIHVGVIKNFSYDMATGNLFFVVADKIEGRNGNFEPSVYTLYLEDLNHINGLKNYKLKIYFSR